MARASKRKFSLPAILEILGTGLQMTNSKLIGVILIFIGFAWAWWLVTPKITRHLKLTKNTHRQFLFGGGWALILLICFAYGRWISLPTTSGEIQTLLREEVQDADYRDLVAEVIRSIDPEAHIAVGNAINGPDGFRKVDVEIRSRDNELAVVDIISSPDGRKIGVESVDQADSKRKDIKADTMLICSNTGFDEVAIRKAKRMRIGLITVAKRGDQRATAVIQEEIYLRKVNIDPVTITVDGVTKADGELLRAHAKDMHDVTFHGGSVARWLEHRATAIITFNPAMQGRFTATFHLKNPTTFNVQGHPVMLQSLTIQLYSHVQWLSQVVELDATSAIYNYTRGRFVLSPGSNTVIINGVNFDTATPMASPPPVTTLGFGLLPGEMDITFMRIEGLDILKDTKSTIPKLDHLIKPEDLSLRAYWHPITK